MFYSPKIFSASIEGNVISIKSFNKNNALKYFKTKDHNIDKRNIIEMHVYNNDVPIEFIHPELYESNEIYF